MAIIEIENLIQQLQPKYFQELRQFIDYLLFVQNNQAAQSNSNPAEPEAENVPERLKALRQFKGDARYPDYPTSKYDVYEQ